MKFDECLRYSLELNLKLPQETADFIRYLSSQAKNKNRPMVVCFFKNLLGEYFAMDRLGSHLIGRLPGNLVVSLKNYSKDTLLGLMVAVASAREEGALKYIVCVHRQVIIWYREDLPSSFLSDIERLEDNFSDEIVALEKKWQKKWLQLLHLSTFIFESPALQRGTFVYDHENLKYNLHRLKELIGSEQKKRHLITPENFLQVLQGMKNFFEVKDLLAPMKAFYTLLPVWNKKCSGTVGRKKQVVHIDGVDIFGLKENQRESFIRFVTGRSVADVESYEIYYLKFRHALEVVVPQKNRHELLPNLYFIRLIKWMVAKQTQILDLNCLAVDPFCCGGSFFSNWKAPLHFHRTVLFDRTRDLLPLVLLRSQSDDYAARSQVFVPGKALAKGIDFEFEKSSQIIKDLKNSLALEGSQKSEHLFLFLDLASQGFNLESEPGERKKIFDSISRILYKTIVFCQQIKDSGFVKSCYVLMISDIKWLKREKPYHKIAGDFTSHFKLLDGAVFNSKECLETQEKSCAAFSLWQYSSAEMPSSNDDYLKFLDLTWLRKTDLEKIDWFDQQATNHACLNLFKDKLNHHIRLDVPRPGVQDWVGCSELNIKVDRRRVTKQTPDQSPTDGIPLQERRHQSHRSYGVKKGLGIGFLNDLTPVRVAQLTSGRPWFQLDRGFSQSHTMRLLSGPGVRGVYSGDDFESTKKLFVWYALARIFTSQGHPGWVEGMDIWGVNLNMEVVRMAVAIALADNHCVHAVVPSYFPSSGATEITVLNPMAPLDENSFWSQHLAVIFNQGSSVAHTLVRCVRDVYDEWKAVLGEQSWLEVPYPTNYFVGEPDLVLSSGLVQIRSYARYRKIISLIAKLDALDLQLSQVKKSFKHRLMDSCKLNYFS